MAGPPVLCFVIQTHCILKKHISIAEGYGQIYIKKLKQKIKKNKRRENIKRKLIIKKKRRGIEKNKEKQTPK
jgi:hypothetical protein